MTAGGTLEAQRPGNSARERLRRERPVPLFPLEAAWTRPLPAAPSQGPAIDSRRVYVALTDNTVLAADRDTGEPAWTAAAPAVLPPVAATDVVLVAGERSLAALGSEAGTPRWASPLEQPPHWLLVADGLALVGLGPRVRALALADGAVRWTLDLDAPVRTRPAAAAGALVVADDQGRVTVLDLAAGTRRWTRALPGRPGAVTMTADQVFVGTTAREFHALAAADGTTRWSWRTGGDVAGARADGDRVFVTTLDNLVRALDAATGNQRWKATLTTRPAGAPLLLTNLVVVAGISGRVDGFARKAGAAAGLLLPAAELAGEPGILAALEPFRVAAVVATRAGVLTGLRPERMMFREPRSAPLTVLPGRRAIPEPVPSAAGLRER